jgi:hypothetical protein
MMRLTETLMCQAAALAADQPGVSDEGQAPRTRTGLQESLLTNRADHVAEHAQLQVGSPVTRYVPTHACSAGVSRR